MSAEVGAARVDDGGREDLVDRYAVVVEDVPATNVRVVLRIGEERVGSVDALCHGGFLSIGMMEVLRPDGMVGEAWSGHVREVSARLLAEVVRLGEARKVSVLLMSTAWPSTAQLAGLGFQEFGRAWWLPVE